MAKKRLRAVYQHNKAAILCDVNQARLFECAPSMLALLEKAFPIIEEEAERRECVAHMSRIDDPYWTEMRQLANTIQAEIAKAKGDTVIDAELCPHGFGFVEYCPDCEGKEVQHG